MKLYLIVLSFCVMSSVNAEEGLKGAFDGMGDFLNNYKLDNLKSDTKEGLTENIDNVKQFLTTVGEKGKDIAKDNPLLKSIVEKVGSWADELGSLKNEVASASDSELQEKSKEWNHLASDMDKHGLSKLVKYAQVMNGAPSFTSAGLIFLISSLLISQLFV